MTPTTDEIHADLLHELRDIYGQDPMVIARADKIVRDHTWTQATYDETGHRIDPSLAVIAVRGLCGWYTVRTGQSCSCRSAAPCAHRIAAWILREHSIRADMSLGRSRQEAEARADGTYQYADIEF